MSYIFCRSLPPVRVACKHAGCFLGGWFSIRNRCTQDISSDKTMRVSTARYGRTSGPFFDALLYFLAFNRELKVPWFFQVNHTDNHSRTQIEQLRNYEDGE